MTSREERLVETLTDRTDSDPIAAGMHFPNPGGDHSKARVRQVPTQDDHIVNKKYLDQVAQNIIPEIDNTFNLGSLTKRWAQIFAVIAILGSIVIGGAIRLQAIDGILFINASTKINGSLNVTGNITGSIYFGDGSQLTGIEAGGTTLWVNSSGNATYDAGFVGIGTTTPGDSLEIGSGALMMPDGSAGTPSIRASSRTADDSGIYFPSGFETAIARAGTQVFITTNAGVIVTALFIASSAVGKMSGAGPSTIREGVNLFGSAQRMAIFYEGSAFDSQDNPLSVLATSGSDNYMVVARAGDTQNDSIFEVQDGSGNRLVVIDSKGQMGLGTFDPNSTLHIEGGFQMSDLRGAYTGGNASICVFDNGTFYADASGSCSTLT